ncbi:MAG: enoyl-CoA hydratase/isomerase family protein [Clostridiales bacterium]|nr:enoyl-CoA hydratase/isomerase family protein [Clostridiales bacterium]
MNENLKMPNLATAQFNPVPVPVPFEEYSKKYEGHLHITRTPDGVVLMQLNNNGGPIIWARPIHRAFHMAVRDIASDPDNKLLIITGTGDYWVGYGLDPGGMKSSGIDESTHKARAQATIEDYTGDAIPLQENLIYDLNIPTIALINGPGYHMDMTLQCDLAICTDDTVMFDVHPHMGFLSGDGINISMAETMGSKRAAYYMMTGDPVTAKQAVEWGMVNEAVPREKLLERGMEIAHRIMEVGKGRPGWLRWMVEVVRKPMKTRFANDFAGMFAMEMYAYMIDENVSHNDESIIAMWNSGDIELPHWEDNPKYYLDINDYY